MFLNFCMHMPELIDHAFPTFLYGSTNRDIFTLACLSGYLNLTTMLPTPENIVQKNCHNLQTFPIYITTQIDNSAVEKSEKNQGMETYVRNELE